MPRHKNIAILNEFPGCCSTSLLELGLGIGDVSRLLRSAEAISDIGVVSLNEVERICQCAEVSECCTFAICALEGLDLSQATRTQVIRYYA